MKILLMRTIFAAVRPRPIGLAVLLVGGLLFSPLVRAESTLIVHWGRDELSVVARDVPLARVLSEIARHTRLELRGAEHLRDEIFVNLSNVGLDQGLKKLLAHLNYVLVEEPRPDGVTTPVLVIVFGGESRLAAARIVGNQLPELVADQQPEVETATEPDLAGPPAGEPTTAPVFPGAQGFGDGDRP